MIPFRTDPVSYQTSRLLDPRSRSVQKWNRVVLLARGLSLAVDPVFFYVIFLGNGGGGGRPCFYSDAVFAAVVTVVRTCVDLVHLWHVWMQFRLAYVSTESLVVGCGRLVWDARAIVHHYVRSMKGFWLDVFVIIPIPQVVTWLVVPKLLRKEEIKEIMRIVLVTYLFQLIPKLYHTIYLITKLQKVTGFIFASIWWRFNLNLFAYLIASHVAGGCWYLLATQRLILCLEQQCDRRKHCKLGLSCSEQKCYKSDYNKEASKFGDASCVGNLTMIQSLCLEANGPFSYGIYEPMLLVFSSNSLAVRTLYPVFWGLLNLSTFGNVLEPTSNLMEVIFSSCITLSGLVLFVTLIGNIQVFLQTVMASKKKIYIRFRDMQWWMKRRQLPVNLRQRVCDFEYQRWEAMGGVDEIELIGGLPDGLRRDIKRYLCLDLVKKVPLFHMLDDLILDNICDRVKPLLFAQGEKIVREGDPVKRMVFIVRGCIKRSECLQKGFSATSWLNSGGFFGDELLSWCVRRPFFDELPSSLATFSCVQPVEAYSLNADDLRYITELFWYTFASERIKRTMRYHSSKWRRWGALIIQLSWRRHQTRTRGSVTQNISIEDRQRQYASIILSLKPHDHLE